MPKRASDSGPEPEALHIINVASSWLFEYINSVDLLINECAYAIEKASFICYFIFNKLNEGEAYGNYIKII